jgi:hypothetical protein
MDKPLDLTKPVQMRNGTPVRILATDLDGLCPVVGAYRSARTGKEVATTWTRDGRYLASQVGECFSDLVNVTTKRKLWLNVYSDDIAAHDSRAEADRAAFGRRLACVEVEIEY